MGDEGKKVSFGFAKSIKKTALKILPPPEEKKIDYIEYVDGKSIKVLGEEEKIDSPLVIPLLGSKTWHDRILNKTDADIFEPKTRGKENGVSSTIANGHTRINDNGTMSMDVSEIKQEKCDEPESVPKTLEEQAASEIIRDLTNKDIKPENSNLEVALAPKETLRGEIESTLEDYEQIPIDAFGLAMLRGMGWKPGKGIGKNEKLVTAALPELRPRGMGLGADKVTLQKKNIQPQSKEEEQLKVEKGSFVKIIAGKHANNYGQVEGFDDEGGRVIVKMALTGESKSLTESLIQPVTKSEYTKNSKVLNAAKYEKYKNASKQHDVASRIETLDSDSSDEEDSKKRPQKRERTSKTQEKTNKRSKYTSDDGTDSDERRKQRRNSSDSNSDYRHKRTKKVKKSHKRDSSSERSRKKSKKRDKEREKTRQRKNDNSETLERKKHKKHKKSRSRSPARR